ncbi:class I SAM-dependent methyltransferase [Ornithinimicrobium humiphilum]|uniref:Methyltransferase family protein n=1 Tax=Ornithinimicrobium humiphilum TaxID=125288 RepID=A0A543KKG3_9MICO|nr:methyltransferase domain-containing protein [Ornithinimicrobium humiphilum]TQM95565.1 methyltransferase family protein [Ornithinimicrobium humiphilum]
MSSQGEDREQQGRSTTEGRRAPVDPVPSTTPTTLWPGLDDPEHSRWYVERFRDMARSGQDLHGEARLVDALVPRGARLLDAGCGPGRHGGHLARLGHTVVGVDIDPELVAAAAEDHPGATWLVADLVTLDLPALGQPEPFDGALVAGNVLDFVPAEHQAEAVRRIAAHVRRDGVVVIGCRVGRGFSPEDLDAAAPSAGLTLEHRFATWDLRPWGPDADFCVSVLRR